MKRDWIETQEMADMIGIHTCSLHKLRKAGFFKEKQHWMVKNPLAKRGTYLWHHIRVRMAMNQL